MNDSSLKDREMVYVDLSHPIQGGDSPYPGDPQVVVEQWASVEKDHYELKRLSFGTHSSTHLDAPSHLIKGGKSLDEFPLQAFFHQGEVVECTTLVSITKGDIPPLHKETTAILFYTGWQDRWNTPSYYSDPPLLAEEALLFLLRQGITLFGFDSSSCDALSSETLDNHRHILTHNALIAENLCNLEKVPHHPFSLVALPLLVSNSDGSPARIIASYKK